MMWSSPKPGIIGAICSVSSSLHGLPWRSSGLSYCVNSPEVRENKPEVSRQDVRRKFRIFTNTVRLQCLYD